MNRERVQMLRDMMWGIPFEKVKLEIFYTRKNGPCDTVACMGGWAAIYPPFVSQGLGNPGFAILANFFEVPARTFFPRSPSDYGTDKEIALRRLDKLLATGTEPTSGTAK